jgi:hypothetical protein
MYQVKRFSGRASDNYRTVFESDDEEKARAKFNSLVEKMRQGGVMLVKDEITIDEVKAPNLRSRW